MESLLAGNQQWVLEVERAQPDFFATLAAGQAPPFLYIGCADSRVAPDHFLACRPGRLFVTRNVANQVRDDDLALTSVVAYALEVLEVEHVILCGHTGCGGVLAAMADEQPQGSVGQWIAPLKKLVEEWAHELEGLCGEARVNRMVELNVAAQVRKLAELAPMQRAWAAGRRVDVHGWVFNLSNGRVRELTRVTRDHHLARPSMRPGAVRPDPGDR